MELLVRLLHLFLAAFFQVSSHIRQEAQALQSMTLSQAIGLENLQEDKCLDL